MRPNSILRWMAITGAAIWPALATGQVPPKVSDQDLGKQGFNQDIDELRIEDLLQEGGIRTSVASLSQLSIDHAPGTVTVVTADQIRRLGLRTLGDVLRTIPGFDIVTDRLGRPRVALRGVVPSAHGDGSETILFLYNGQRLNEPIWGGLSGANLRIPVDDVKQIEILRGPGSALYGSSALTGVVNIVPAGVKDFKGTEARLGVGSFGAKELSLRLGNPIRGVEVSGFAHIWDNDKAGLLVRADAQTAFDQALAPLGVKPASLAPGDATDTLRSVETTYRVRYKAFRAGLRVKRDSSEGLIGAAEALGTQNDLNGRQMIIDAGYETRVHGWRIWASAALLQTENKDLMQYAPPGFTLVGSGGGRVTLPGGVYLQTSLASRSLTADVGGSRALHERHTLTLGLTVDHSATRSLGASANVDPSSGMPFPSGQLTPLAGAVEDASRTTVGLVAQDVWTASPRVTVTGGLRLDALSDVGSVVSPRLAVRVGLPPNATLKLMYGRSFRAPSLGELHFSLPGFSPNPDLKPSTADTIEAGWIRTGDRYRIEGTAFLTQVRDAIAVSGGFTALGTQPLVNEKGVRVAGVEVDVSRSIGLHSLFGALTLQSPKDLESGLRAAWVPVAMLQLGASLSFEDRFFIAPRLTLGSSRARQEGDLRPAARGFSSLDIHLRAVRLFRTLELSATARSLIGRNRVDPSLTGAVPDDYPRPGANLHINASFRF
jgi:outer membrane receptor protein involved in Fe transport